MEKPTASVWCRITYSLNIIISGGGQLPDNFMYPAFLRHFVRVLLLILLWHLN